MEKHLKIKWSEQAINNFIEEMDFIAQNSLQNAELVSGRIEKAVEALSSSPNIGRPGKVAETRELIVKKTRYIIPYHINEETNTIEIIRVFHTLESGRQYYKEPVLRQCTFIPTKHRFGGFYLSLGELAKQSEALMLFEKTRSKCGSYMG